MITEIFLRLGRHCSQSKCDSRDFVQAREALYVEQM